VASYPVDSRTKEGLLHLADEAMYLVKNTKRDSVAAANIGILPNVAPPNPPDNSLCAEPPLSFLHSLKIFV